MIEHLISVLRQRNVVLRLENKQLLCDAPQGMMSPELIEQIERNKEAIIKFLEQKSDQDRSRSMGRTLDGTSEGAEIPLSFSQESLWFLEQLNPGSSAYNIPLKISIAASVDSDVLQRSLDEIVRRHQVLRTRFRVVGGRPLRSWVLRAKAPFTVMDLSTDPIEVRGTKANQWCASELTKRSRSIRTYCCEQRCCGSDRNSTCCCWWSIISWPTHLPLT